MKKLETAPRNFHYENVEKNHVREKRAVKKTDHGKIGVLRLAHKKPHAERKHKESQQQGFEPAAFIHASPYHNYQKTVYKHHKKHQQQIRIQAVNGSFGFGAIPETDVVDH